MTRHDFRNKCCTLQYLLRTTYSLKAGRGSFTSPAARYCTHNTSHKRSRPNFGFDSDAIRFLKYSSMASLGRKRRFTVCEDLDKSYFKKLELDGLSGKTRTVDAENRPFVVLTQCSIVNSLGAPRMATVLGNPGEDLVLTGLEHSPCGPLKELKSDYLTEWFGFSMDGGHEQLLLGVADRHRNYVLQTTAFDYWAPFYRSKSVILFASFVKRSLEEYPSVRLEEVCEAFSNAPENNLPVGDDLHSFIRDNIGSICKMLRACGVSTRRFPKSPCCAAFVKLRLENVQE